ncbi:phage tail assembly protein [Novosphingobium sp. ST904]|uniref:phage tail assembly protein n=1 Tax=Novosphingobium sp. ST904 TaxID=1684385 RepID=UPI0006C8DCCB|nr:phage tail assembly protein [Novosphingobium sp. ST904]KPH62320.1 hypothetical protein ADT71_15390 [Novosphingobium sp. ST904]TCM43338.1 tail assembly chaperone E/41/14-like protein [Novosphingobium sp. ST904]
MATQPDTAAQNGLVFETVTLATPIIRGETHITSITLKKPMGGELRGLALQDLLQTDVTAILKVIPRISNPPLLQDEADRLPADDLAQIGGTIRGFFLTPAERTALEAMIAEHLPKT